ncbi:MAG: non-ribosomal peptide synthetase, partial [Tumebacillaceae bacterium]
MTGTKGLPFATETRRLSGELSHALDELSEQAGVSKRTITQAAWAILLSVYSSEETVSYGLTCAGRPTELTGVESMVGLLANTLPFFVRVDGEQTTSAFLRSVQEQANQLEQHAYVPLTEVISNSGLSESSNLFASRIAVYEEPQIHEWLVDNEVLKGHEVLASYEVLKGHEVLASYEVLKGHDVLEGYKELAGNEAHFGHEDTIRLETERISSAQSQTLSIDVNIASTWTLTFTYATDALSSETVTRMMDHFQTVLESMANAPQARVSELNLIPAAEQQRLFHDFNQTKLPAPALDRMAHQIIEEQAEARPQDIAAICGSERITYAELNERANRLAHWLRAQGFGRDDLAALLAERSLEMLIAIVAVLKAGGAYVPLDSDHPDSRIQQIVESSEVKVILTQHDLAERAVGIARNLPVMPVVFCLNESSAFPDLIDVKVLTEYASENPPHITEPHDLANVFFTSGSTGQPKGAMVEHIGMLNHLWAKINLLGLSETSIVAQNASHCFDISVWQFLAPLMVGGCVVIYPNDVAFDAQELVAAVKRDRVTVLEMVPAMIELFLQISAEQTQQDRTLPDLLYMISTGEGLSVPLCNKWLEHYPEVRVVNTYGATECSDDTSHEVITGVCRDEDLSHVALGTPIPNFKMYLLDRWQRPVPIGCTGEVCMTGIGVGRGYLNDPERTAKAFVPNPFADGMGERMYKTGDLARYLPDGRLAFVNRADFQVKVRGYRIELGEVEVALLKLPSVSQGIAVVRPDASGQNRILAYVVLSEAVDLVKLRDSMHAWLPEYMIPEQIIALPELPLNRNGKIDRKALPDPEESTRSQEAYLAPSDEVESGLADIWSGVLEVSKVGVDDNFFSLGGHSLKTMQVRARIKKQFGVDISLKTLFDCQTIRELAPCIRQLVGEESGAWQQPIERLPQLDVYQMSHAQKRLYLIQTLEPQNTTYNMLVALELLGALDVESLHRAFQTIVDRHATLRTTFTLQNGVPVQRVSEQRSLPCPIDDLSHLSGDACEQAIKQVIAAERSRGVDLENGPLFRIRVIKCTPERHLLLLTIHHIISDGWSGGVLTQ